LLHSLGLAKVQGATAKPCMLVGLLEDKPGNTEQAEASLGSAMLQGHSKDKQSNAAWPSLPSASLQLLLPSWHWRLVSPGCHPPVARMIGKAVMP
jgi:hypothetical protein